MIADPELAAAVRGRRHWRADHDEAVYEPPGATVTVRIRALPHPAGRERYHAAVIRDAAATAAINTREALTAVRWAERAQLS